MIRFRLVLAALSLLPLTGAEAPRHWSADTIPWERAGANGTKFALLEGRRDTPGEPFSYAFFVPAGVWDAPHRHSATARVFVLKGALRLGYGDILDKDSARVYPAGSYLIVPADAVHFDGAVEDTVIIGTAAGPWATQYLGKGTPASAGTPIG